MQKLNPPEIDIDTIYDKTNKVLLNKIKKEYKLLTNK